MKSMTGFASEEGSVAQGVCTIEMKSINHRFLDIRCRLPSDWSFLELATQERLRKSLKRGTVDVIIRNKYASLDSKPKISFEVDEKALESYLEAHQQIQKHLGQKAELAASEILKNDKIVFAVEAGIEKEKVERDFLKILDRAIEKLVLSREKEGGEIAQSFGTSLKQLQKHVETIEGLSAGLTDETRKKLLERIEKWKLKDLDANRLEWEVAFYADRGAIQEEIDRLQSHIRAFQDEIKKGNEIGRRLDFITQEMHREINTIGSKTQDIEITKLCIASKSEIEKLREQAQNVE